MTHRRVVVMLDAATSLWGQRAVAGIAAFARRHRQWDVFIDRMGGELVQASSNLDAIDGVIMGRPSKQVLEALRSRGIPATSITADGAPGVPGVATDHSEIGRIGAQHLLDRGFRNLAFVADSLIGGPSQERLAGFQQVVSAQRIEVAIHDVGSLGPAERRRSLGRAARWLRRQPRPLGIMASNDPTGRHVIAACGISAFRVPDDVAVLGVSDSPTFCEMMRPSMSSVDTATEQRGYRAAELLDSLMKGQAAPTQIIRVPSRGVMVRQSTDTTAVADPLVADVLRFIRSRAGTQVSPADVMATVPMSRRSLERRLLKATGRSLTDEIRRAHTEQAKKLLSQTDLPIKAIAAQCGFATLKSFSAIFTRDQGESPRDYRRRFRVER